ncbi:MAG: hypothetical protein ACXABK_00720 [Candidatus Heimdallarchaeaceae archaeon]
MTEYRKRELLLYYGGAYMIIAILNAILFSSITGSWGGIDLLFTFSVWGLIWLITMFAYPMFFMNAQQDLLALPGGLAALGWVIIIAVYTATYFLHKRLLEKKEGTKLSFRKILDLYFPPKDE